MEALDDRGRTTLPEGENGLATLPLLSCWLGLACNSDCFSNTGSRCEDDGLYADLGVCYGDVVCRLRYIHSAGGRAGNGKIGFVCGRHPRPPPESRHSDRYQQSDNPKSRKPMQAH